MRNPERRIILSKFFKATVSAAGLVAASLSLCAVAGVAQAAPYAVKVADLQLDTADGQKTLTQRAEVVSQLFCAANKPVGTLIRTRANCADGVVAEVKEKAVAVQTQLAAAHKTTLASR
jgi:UrcA family protein